MGPTSIARRTLPLVIIVIIIIVAAVDHIAAKRIAQVELPTPSSLVSTHGGSATVDLDQHMAGFNPNTSAGAASATPTVMASVLPSAYIINPQHLAVPNAALLQSVEVIKPAPLTISYVINPKAVWSDGTPVTAEDFIYAWESQRGVGVDIDGKPSRRRLHTRIPRHRLGDAECRREDGDGPVRNAVH